jgi:ribulose-5-phosphate 4-epimerase/fuculose-1-phosphate aldolase
MKLSISRTRKDAARRVRLPRRSDAQNPPGTDILSEYLKGYDRNVIHHAANYARQHGVFTFTSVTVHEIVYGLELKDAAAQLQKALLWLNQNEQITPTSADYLQAAIIKARSSQTRLDGSTP